jgi:phosphoesterase RecJ-like protein
VNIVDPQKSSTAELVFEFFKHNGLYITKDSATALYVGIYDDTLAFSLGRCDETTFEKINFLVECGASPSEIANKLLRRDSLAKYRIIPKVLDSLELYKEGEIASIIAMEEWFKQTGAHNRDCEDALDMVMSIAVVKVAIFVRISNGVSRVSLRSKGQIDVSKIAGKFDGGGHFNASGCTIEILDVEKVKEIVLKEIFETYK